MSDHPSTGEFAGSERDAQQPASCTPAGEAVTLAPSEENGAAAPADIPSVPGYEVLAELGRGGMGVVYRARQTKLNRTVALKMVLHGSHASATELVRFLAEGETVAQLQHPHIVAIYEIGQQAGIPFFSLEYVDGGTLAQRLASGPLPPRQAAQLTQTLARAMTYAHGRGLIHRDLKPSNILLTADGTPKITDFGLAKRATGTEQLTATGAILGTPSYMAPEQAQGRKDVTPLCDVYALGALLYEMLTGRPPFQAPTPVDTIMQVISVEPVPPSRLQPGVPRDLETICLKCLQKEPHKRYAGAQALADDLARFQEDRPIVARPVGRLERGWRWCRRNPLLAGMAAAVAASVLVAGLLLYQERSQTLKNLTRAEGAEHDLTDQLDRTATAERERTEQLWKSYRDQAEARRFSRQAGQRFESLKALAEAARIARDLGLGEDVLGDLRRKAIASLALPDLRFERELPGWTSEMVALAIDDRFNRYALRDKQGTVSVREGAVGKELFTPPATRLGVDVWVLGLSPDGRYLAMDNPRQQITVWDLDRKKPAVETPADITGPYAFSPDSRRFVGRYASGDFGVWDLPSDRLERRWATGAGCKSIRFHPEGRQLAAFFGDSIECWSADSGRLIRILRGTGNAEGGTWNPAGKLLAVTGSFDTFIRLWDVPSGEQVGALEGHRNTGLHAAFSPAGDLVASNGWEGMLRLWSPHTARELLRMPAGGFPRFNRRGDRLLMQFRAPQIWEVADGREYRTFVGDPARGKKDFGSGSISPDGQLLAAGVEDGAVLWELATGKELAFLPIGRTWHVLFQPSGDLLTSGFMGLIRWPVRPNPDVAGQYSLGPPERLVLQSTDGVGQSKDGRTVAVAVSGEGCRLLDFNQAGNRDLLPHPGTNKAAISPDGQWAATGCHHGTGIKVWSVRRYKLECELPIQGSATPYFSPDGRWLATTSSAGLQLWKVGTWERGPSLPEGQPVFSPGGRLVAVHHNYSITLVELDSGRTVATLEDPNQDRPVIGCFSPDGAQLVVSGAESSSIHLWDLRRIRAGLKGIGLDWTAQDYSPAPPPHVPLRFEVIDGDLQGAQVPFVKVTVSRSGHRRATPEQLAGWVKQLTAPDARTRANAAAALEEVGPPALAVLERASGHRDAVVRERIKQLQDRMAVADALATRRFSLKLKDVHAADAIKALANKAGVRLNYTRSLATFLRAKKVSLDLDGKPLLEALDQLCQAAGLVANRTGPESWNLSDGKATARELLAYSGPLRVQSRATDYQRWFDLPGNRQPQEQLRVWLAVESEGRSAVLSHGPPRAVEARDHTGRSLLHEGPIGGDFTPIGAGNPMVLLQPPGVRGGKLPRLRFVLPVEVMARRRDMVTVPDVFKAGGKTFSGEAGFRLKVQSVQVHNPTQVQVEFSLSLPSRVRLAATSLGVRLSDARGEELSIAFLHGNSIFQNVRELEAEDLLCLSGAGLGGFLTPLPWAALAPGILNHPRRHWTGSAPLATRVPVGSSVRFTLIRFERLRTELPFELRDLPLP